MFTTQWDPRGEMGRLQNEMNRIFGRVGDGREFFAPAAYPALNVWQDDDHVYVEAELPGFELNDLVIYVTGANQLSLKGERKQPNLGPKAAWHRQERGYGAFSRVCDLP
jgi:HSP20 family protein